MLHITREWTEKDVKVSLEVVEGSDISATYCVVGWNWKNRRGGGSRSSITIEIVSPFEERAPKNSDDWLACWR